MGVREDLSAAVNTVAGLSCTPYFRQTTKAGDAYVRLDRMNRDLTGFGFIYVWQVLLVLPQDLANAEKYAEDRVAALTEAINDVLVVMSVTFHQLALDSGLLPVVIVEGNRAI